MANATHTILIPANATVTGFIASPRVRSADTIDGLEREMLDADVDTGERPTI
jgi:hypothetical protein